MKKILGITVAVVFFVVAGSNFALAKGGGQGGGHSMENQVMEKNQAKAHHEMKEKNKSKEAEMKEKSAPQTQASTTPPGLEKHGKTPAGLEKQNKTPAGWNKGKKTGWKKGTTEKK